MSYWFGDENWIFDKDYRVEWKDYARYGSECALSGMPLTTSLRKFLSEEDIEAGGEMFEYHTKDNPHKPMTSPTLYGGMRARSELMFGKAGSPEERLRQDQLQPALWTQTAVEAIRRNKWYSAGVQFWMYNDCWPALGWSMVDFYMVPKGGYFGAKRASQPVILSVAAEEEGWAVWLCNDGFRPAEGTLALSMIEHESGRIHPLGAMPITSPANENRIARTFTPAELPLPMDGHTSLIAEFTGSFEPVRAIYCQALPRDMVFAPTQLEVDVDCTAGAITVSSSGYARAVTIDGDCAPADNFFDMLPGETRIIRCVCYNGFSLKEAQVYCWNQQADAPHSRPIRSN